MRDEQTFNCYRFLITWHELSLTIEF
jgi:hypothetical protein